MLGPPSSPTDGYDYSNSNSDSNGEATTLEAPVAEAQLLWRYEGLDSNEQQASQIQISSLLTAIDGTMVYAGWDFGERR